MLKSSDICTKRVLTKFTAMKLQIAVFCFIFVKVADSVILECTFAMTFDQFYTCTNHNLNLDQNKMQITSVKGSHLGLKTDADVQGIYFLSSGMKRLPRGIFKVFKNLQKYIVHGLDTVGEFLESEGLVKGDFEGAKSLTSLSLMSVIMEHMRPRVFEGASNLIHVTLEACRIVTIDKDAFRGLKKLQSLGLKYNYIATLHASTFSDLDDLQHLLLSGNYLKTITSNHFKNNKKLVRISLIGNLLSEVESNLIQNLKNLEHIYLDQNICIDEHFGTDGVPFSKFEKFISSCSHEAAHVRNGLKHAEEIRTLEKEIQLLQQLVEKYKNQNCGMTMKFGGLNDGMWTSRKEMN